MAVTIATQRISANGRDALSSGPAEADGSAGFSVVTQLGIQGYNGTTYYQSGYTYVPPIPQGATIISATISVLAHKIFGTRGDTVNWKIVGLDADNAANVWSTNYRPGTGGAPGRDPETSAGVDWDRTGFVANTRYTSPDISAIVQEIVNRPGWVSINRMAIVIRNDGSNNGFAYVQHPALNEDNVDSAYFDCTYTLADGQILTVNIF